MKYKLLSVGKDKKLPPSINIGDYIQAVAASQFLPSIDGFIDRDEELKVYDGEECKVIMNGWYMHKPQNWPPSPKINPLFVAFHINSAYTNYFKTKESIAYLKRFEPIGCRDIHTLNFLESQNVNAYFSGCLTLTLGQKYASKKKNDTIYFVDPYVYYKLSVGEIFRNFLLLFSSLKTIVRIAKKMDPYRMDKNMLMKLYGVSCFYRQYKNVFSPEILIRANYISHISKKYRKEFTSEVQLLREAERLVNVYSTAKLVITSRIHCALPCLGLGTKVIFVKDNNLDESNASRLNGLVSFFNVVTSDRGQLLYEGKPVTFDDILKFENKDSWKSYRDMLVKTCQSFVRL